MSAPLDLLIVNGRVWTDGACRAGTDAVGIAGERIIALGRSAELRSLAGPATRIVDAGGATVTPGLADAHLHFEPWARALAQPDLTGAGSRAAALELVRRHLERERDARPLVGRGWDANGWSEAPDAAALDAVSGERPVVLNSKDFHAVWVNHAALRAAGVEPSTPDPPGGRFERDARGALTGIVRETAVRAFAALEGEAGPAPDPDVLDRAARALHARGVTMVHDFERRAATLHRMQALARRRALRVLQHFGLEQLEGAIALGLESGAGDDWFRIGALKLFADGTLGSRTAAMLAPYNGTNETGMDVTPAALLIEQVARAASHGVAVAIHAIGDRAVRHALDAFERARSGAAAPALPQRLEHAQLVDPADLPRFAALGVAASMQPQHAVVDAELAERYWGTRCATAYPWRALLDSGALLAFGSDAPVEPPKPSLGLHAAVTRQRPDGYPSGGFVPAQRLTLDETLTAYTVGPARLAGAWPGLGSLASHAAADVVIWDRELHRCEPLQLPAARPRLTVLAGAVVHEDDGPLTS